MNIMKKNVVLIIFMSSFAFSSVSAQSFLKKVGDAAKKVTQTEQSKDDKQQAVASKESAGPISVSIESTRYIGDKLLISGKLLASEDLRLMLTKITAITPDGDTYESKDMWFGGKQTPPMSFDNKLIADINYAVDIAIEVKGKQINNIASLTIDAFNHTAQKYFKIPLKNITIPNPVDPNLDNPSVIEISKDIYLRWTKVEETANSFKVSFVVENKGSKDVEMRFISYNNAKITDDDGNSYDATLTLKDRVDFPAGTPVAGSISVNKPIKVSKISLLEFSSHNFKYKIKKVVIPQ